MPKNPKANAKKAQAEQPAETETTEAKPTRTKATKFKHVDESVGSEPAPAPTNGIEVTAVVVGPETLTPIGEEVVKATKKPNPKPKAKNATPQPTDVQPERPTTAAPVTEAPAKKSGGIRKPQVRILAYLAKQKQPVTRKQIAEGAPVDLAFCTEYLGSEKDDVRLKNDVKLMSLKTLGYIEATSQDIEGKAAVAYSITAAGKDALKDAT